MRLLSKTMLGADATENRLRRPGWPHHTALIAFMKGVRHASFSTIWTFLRDCVGVTLARSTLANTIDKVSRALEGSHDEL